ncbi:MAG: peptidylprolyl isomerase [Bacteroidales bacterium]|nr:peptidylprolyl isomerase [Bacteroidales bacterium]MBN2818749.1 peptidylprolyl isomerase [Bacteroidales bacterium]
MIYRFLTVFFIGIISLPVFSQPFIADKIVAVVGKTTILYSDVEDQYMQLLAQGEKVDKCTIFEDMLAQKLMVAQAEIDSIEISPGEVEMELEQRLTYFINQIGSEEKLVAYFNKSVIEIKEDMRDMVREQILMQRMQGEIVKGMSITPKEVKEFYNSLHPDSIPYVDSEIEINQITIYPRSSETAIFEVKEKLLNIRERIQNGENFATLAVLYSEGPSATRGGDIGWSGKAELDPAYAKAAFALKKNQVSKIVESAFGFHIIQLLDKTEDRVKTRHILMKPKISTEAKEEILNKLDSLATLIRIDSMTFEKAAMYYSQDEDTRLNGGLKVNPATMNTRFKINEFSGNEYYLIRKLKVGEISEPYESVDNKGKTVYKIVQLKSRTEPHKANVKDDFDMLKSMALNKKRSQIVDDWVEEKAGEVYTRIEEPFKNCDFTIKSWKK